MKSLFIISALFLFVSCNQNKKIDKEQSEKTSDSMIETNEADENGVQVVENNVLVNYINENLESERKNAKYIIEKDAIANKYNPDLMDTIKTYKLNKDQIKTYKTKDKEWVIGAKILTQSLEILKTIKIGANKTQLEKILNIAIYSEIVKLENEEQTNTYIFKFKDDMLVEMEYEGYFD